MFPGVGGGGGEGRGGSKWMDGLLLPSGGKDAKLQAIHWRVQNDSFIWEMHCFTNC